MTRGPTFGKSFDVNPIICDYVPPTNFLYVKPIDLTPYQHEI